MTETVRALDGIAIIVNPDNPVNDLDLETIGKIYKGEITNWKGAGGSDLEIVLIGREAGSGTRDGVESITGTEDTCKYRQELTSTGDVITTVAGNPGAIGYASLASVKDTVKMLSVGGVAPTEETVKDFRTPNFCSQHYGTGPCMRDAAADSCKAAPARERTYGFLFRKMRRMPAEASFQCRFSAKFGDLLLSLDMLY